MTKYDFGYEILPGTTTEWAWTLIPAGSCVLEFGPSIGYLTKALKEKSCCVDIVEIDGDAGVLAAQYARKALIGPETGNVETFKWCAELSESSYDAIVFLDVLEHLHDPEKILSRVIKYLKPEGKLYLSIPNIAHNSVLINLINNKWEYTQLGLLDNTHLHFFAYHSLIKLFHSLNLGIEYQGAIQKMVGDIEIDNDYSDIPMELATGLKQREYADAYQFLFCLSLGIKRPNNDLQLNKLPNTGLSVELNYQYPGIDVSSQDMIKQYYSGPSYCEEIVLPYKNQICPSHLVVTFPFHCCVVADFSASADILPNQCLPWITNGLSLENGDIIFSGENKQIDITIPLDTKNVTLHWKILFYDSNVIPYMKAMISVEKECAHDAAKEAITSEKMKLEKLLTESRDYAQSLQNTIHAEQKKTSELENLLESKDFALAKPDKADEINHSRSWKLIKCFFRNKK